MTKILLISFLLVSVNVFSKGLSCVSGDFPRSEMNSLPYQEFVVYEQAKGIEAIGYDNYYEERIHFFLKPQIKENNNDMVVTENTMYDFKAVNKGEFDYFKVYVTKTENELYKLEMYAVCEMCRDGEISHTYTCE